MLEFTHLEGADLVLNTGQKTKQKWSVWVSLLLLFTLACTVGIGKPILIPHSFPENWIENCLNNTSRSLSKKKKTTLHEEYQMQTPNDACKLLQGFSSSS